VLLRLLGGGVLIVRLHLCRCSGRNTALLARQRWKTVMTRAAAQEMFDKGEL
jgi:hypothetical protein